MRSLLVIAACLLSPSVVLAQSVDEAVAAYEAGELEQARAQFDAALRAGGGGPDELHRIHLHLGILAAVMGQPDASRRAWQIALALRPDAPAPAELGPDQRAVFEEIRAASRRLVVAATVVGAPSNETPTTVRVQLTGAPEGAVAQLRSRAAPSSGEPPWTGSVMVSEPTELAIPAMAWRAAPRLELAVDAIDEHGGVLATTTLTLRHATAAPGAALTAPVADEGGSVLEEAWFWVVIGAVVIAGAALGIGLALTIGPEQYILESPTIER